MGKGSGSGRGSSRVPSSSLSSAAATTTAAKLASSRYYLKGGHAAVTPIPPDSAIAFHDPPSLAASSTTLHSPTFLLHHHYHRPKGLRNVGNTCYANAVLQCLLSTALTHALLDPEAGAIFRRYSSNPTLLEQGSGSVDSDDECEETALRSRRRLRPATDKVLHENRKWLAHELKSLMQDYHAVEPNNDSLLTNIFPNWYHPTGVVDPGSITRHPHRLSPCLRPYQQEDAHEFLRGLLSTLVMNGQNRRLSSIFDGLLESCVTCLHCQRPSLTRDRYMDLSLDINQPHILSLTDALEHFTATETLRSDNQVYCGRCERKQDATKVLRLATAPSILVCHLKRFSMDEAGRLVRINKHVSVQTRLQIGPYMSKVNKARPPPYYLVAMLVHQGVSCDSGHYVAFVKHAGEWYMCNDAVVEKVDTETVMQQQAYILMYEVAEMRANHGYPCPHNKRAQPQAHLNFLMCGMEDSLLGDFCCGSNIFGGRSRYRRCAARDDSTLEDSTTTSGRHSPLMHSTMKRSSSSGLLEKRIQSNQLRASFATTTDRPDYILTKKWTPGELPPRHDRKKLVRAVNKPVREERPPLSRISHRRASSANYLPSVE